MSTTTRTRPSIDRARFLGAMAHAVNGVSVLTTDGAAGRFGITVSSVSSVSADPPLVLVCVNRRSPVHDAIRTNGAFCVNLLAARQREIAESFAGQSTKGPAYSFSPAAWTRGATGVPRANDAVSTFECELEQAYVAGSHSIFIGRVVATTESEGIPLLYTARAYGFPCRYE